MSAALEIVSQPRTAASELSYYVDAIAEIQRDVSDLLKKERQLKEMVKERMSAASLPTFVSDGGHRASLLSSQSWRGDRKLALKLLSPSVVAKIFKAVTRTGIVRVK